MENQKQKILPYRYNVIPRTLIFVTNLDEILLIKGAANKKIWPGYFNGIGGHIERGEDVLSAAKRELFEETGIQNIGLELRAVIFIDVDEKQGISMYVFTGNTDQKETLSSEEGTLEWVKIDELKAYPLVEDLYELIPMVLTSDKKIQFGRYYYQGSQLIMEFN